MRSSPHIAFGEQVLCTSEKHDDEQMLRTSVKIKLQLFPVDQRTRLGLEKDGHNPHLELTLGERKKISSVLKHLCKKWGHSSIVVGEPMLFPFNTVMENLASYRRWTLSDTTITAGDVHAAVGFPTVFRLRYGWFITQPNGSSFTTPISVTQFGDVEECCRSNIFDNTVGTEDHTEITNADFKPCNTSELAHRAAAEPTSGAEPLNSGVNGDQTKLKGKELNPGNMNELAGTTAIEGKSSAVSSSSEEPRMDNGPSQTPLLLSDLSNVSVGGLLSEASLQGKFDRSDMRSRGSRSTTHNSLFTFDSVDAFIDQLKCPQASRSQDMPLSILDAEETCHSFAFLKSSGKDNLSPGGCAFPRASGQDVPKPFRSPKIAEDNSKEGILGKNATQEPQKGTMPGSVGLYNDESSLGFSSIRWNDSLGPFDLGLP